MSTFSEASSYIFVALLGMTAYATISLTLRQDTTTLWTSSTTSSTSIAHPPTMDAMKVSNGQRYAIRSSQAHMGYFKSHLQLPGPRMPLHHNAAATPVVTGVGLLGALVAAGLLAVIAVNVMRTQREDDSESSEILPIDVASPPTFSEGAPPTFSEGASPAFIPETALPAAIPWEDPTFQKTTIAAFPAKANATVEEARVLWELDGYIVLDVRSEMEGREGRIQGPSKGSVNVPMFNAKSSYDSNLGKYVVTQEVNKEWMEQVKALLPKDAKIIVVCSDGTKRSSEALDLLSAEGYSNLVLMRGGYNRWDQVFDVKLNVRVPAEQAVKADWLDDPVEWNSWTAAVGKQPPVPREVAESAAPIERTERQLPALGIYQDVAFQQATIAAFPAKVNATIEEARVLWKLDGYSILDIRSEMEGSDGRIRGPNKGSIDIPMFHARSTYDSTLGKRVVTQQANKEWLQQVKARFAKDAKLIIMCSDGTTRSSEAMDILAAEGYTNLVLMRGGYNRWDQVFDRRLALRSPAQQAAKAEWLDDPVKWGTWVKEVGMKAPEERLVPPSAAPATRTERPVPMVGQYQDPEFQRATIAAFPAKANATIEESRVLWKLDGYSILDIRSEMEGREGRIRGPNKGSIDIPMFNAKSTYDSTLGKRVVTQEPNKEWLDEVKARFSKDSKLIIMCSDGTTRSSQAIDLLAAEGYQNLVLMRGGYNRWDQVFDRRLALRPAAQQAAKAVWLDDPVQWGTWAKEVGLPAPAKRPLPPSAAPEDRTVRPMPATEPFMDPVFQKSAAAAFPAKGQVTAEEARALWSQGDYNILDIRSEMEGAEGRIRGPNKGSVDIALINAKAVYDPELHKKVVTQQANTEWLDQVKARFGKNAKIIIMCSDGKTRSAQALKLLQQEGYTEVVVLAGGFFAWDKLYDRRLLVRSEKQQQARAALSDPIQWSQW